MNAVVCRQCFDELGLVSVPASELERPDKFSTCPVCARAFHALPSVPGERCELDCDTVELFMLVRALARELEKTKKALSLETAR